MIPDPLRIAFCLLAGWLALTAETRKSAAEPPAPLVLERTIPLLNVSGRIDHMAVDPRRRRIFVAELGNGSLDVIDINTGNTIHRIGGLHEPQGVGYAPAADIIAVASAADGSVRLFRGEDFIPAGSVQLGDDADNIRLDPQSGAFLVGYGNGGIAVVDPGSKAIVGRTMLSAHPEGFQLDPVGRRLFVNVPDAGQIAVINLDTRIPIATWRLPGLRSNFPMALDASRTVLATVYRDPARLVLLDAKRGTTKANIETCGDADDVFFDTRRQRIYVSCGSGSIDVAAADGNSYRQLARMKTESGARTALFVPEIDRLFVARRAGLFGTDAALLVFQPVP